MFLYYIPLISHATYLSYITSLFSTHQEFEAFSSALHTPLPKTITLIQSRSKPEDTLDQLQQYGYNTIPSTYQPNNYIVHPIDPGVDKQSKPLPLGSTPGHLLGLLYIQETAASIPASIIDIPKSGLILDMCAAPGGKTVQLADRCMISGSSALIWANEPDHKRGKVLYHNIMRCGIYNTITTHYDGKRFGENMVEMFDSILLDAPCSGEGTGFKSNQGTKYRDIRKIQHIAKIQWSLLDSAFKSCKPGGQIIYSTCTINPIENEHMIIKLLETYGSMVSIEEISLEGVSNGLDKFAEDKGSGKYTIECKRCKRLRPHIHHTGGFFLVAIRKTGSLLTHIHHHTPKKLYPPVVKKSGVIIDTADIVKRFYDHYGVDYGSKLSTMIFIQQGEIIYACPPAYSQYKDEYYSDHYGIPLIKGTKLSDRRPLHTAGILIDRGKKYQIVLDDNQIISHIDQKDISWQEDEKHTTKQNGYYQLVRKKNNVGIGKMIDGTIKNKYIGII